jgi:hypothetical protein
LSSSCSSRYFDGLRTPAACRWAPSSGVMQPLSLRWHSWPSSCRAAYISRSRARLANPPLLGSCSGRPAWPTMTGLSKRASGKRVKPRSSGPSWVAP